MNLNVSGFFQGDRRITQSSFAQAQTQTHCLTPTQAEQYLKVMGKLEKALSLLGGRQMVSHIGPDGKWGRVSHPIVSSYKTETCNM